MEWQALSPEEEHERSLEEQNKALKERVKELDLVLKIDIMI